MYKRIVIASILSMGILNAPLFNTSAYASPKVFKQMTGKFRGRGIVKSSAKGKKEAIRCRSTNKSTNKNRLKMRGSCAVGGIVFSLSGNIDHKGGSKYGASVFRSIAAIKRASVSGKGSGNNITFYISGIDRQTNKKVKGTIKLSSRAKSYVLNIRGTDTTTGKIYNVGSITFSK